MTLPSPLWWISCCSCFISPSVCLPPRHVYLHCAHHHMHALVCWLYLPCVLRVSFNVAEICTVCYCWHTKTLKLQVPVTGPLLACTSRMAPGLEWTIFSCYLCMTWATQLALVLASSVVAWCRSSFISLRVCLRYHMCTCTACLHMHAIGCCLYLPCVLRLCCVWVGGFQNAAEIYTVCY